MPLIGKLGGVIIGTLYSILNSVDALLECYKNGGFFQLAAFMILTIAFVAFMTFLISATITGIGLIFAAMFASAMEAIQAQMSSALLETC